MPRLQQKLENRAISSPLKTSSVKALSTPRRAVNRSRLNAGNAQRRESNARRTLSAAHVRSLDPDGEKKGYKQLHEQEEVGRREEQPRRKSPGEARIVGHRSARLELRNLPANLYNRAGARGGEARKKRGPRDTQ